MTNPKLSPEKIVKWLRQPGKTANGADELYGPSFKITRKEVTSSCLDGKALKAASPTVWEQFAKQTTTRRFILA